MYVLDVYYISTWLLFYWLSIIICLIQIHPCFQLYVVFTKTIRSTTPKRDSVTGPKCQNTTEDIDIQIKHV